MANQIYIDPKKEPEDNQAHEQQNSDLGFAELAKIIMAIYSLTAPYFIAFIVLFVLALALIFGYFLL